MVVKSGLRLILLLGLVLLAGSLIAQSEPIRLGGIAFTLPPGWPQSYYPPEVMVRVKVNPDSTLGLVSVLDGKTELEPLLRQHLLSFEYIPSGDSLAEFDAMLDILEAPETGSPLDRKAREELLREIEEWILKDSSGLNFHSPVRPPAELSDLNFVAEPYRSGFFFWAPVDNAVSRSVNGFEQRSSLFSGIWQDLSGLGFLRRQDTHLALDYADEAYPHPVTLSAVEVGIGDYEQLFARGVLKKNRLFGVDRLHLGFGFLIQDGSWLQRDSGRESLLFDLSIPLGKTTLDLGFADHRAGLSQRYLRPEYWRENDFSVERRYRMIHAAWKSPWLNLALLHEKDNSQADVFTRPLGDDALRLRAWETFRIRALSVSALYERMFSWRDSVLVDADHTDLLGFGLKLDGAAISGEANLELKDFQRLRASGELGYTFRKLRFGALGAIRRNDPEPVLQVPSPYIDGATLNRVEFRENAHLGLFLGWQPGQYSKLSLSGGRRSVSNQYLPSGSEYPTSTQQNVNYLRLAAGFNETWNNWNLNWQPALTWQAGYSGLFAEPMLRCQSHLNFSRLLSHENALFAGFSLLGHSDYVNPDQASTNVPASIIMDVWAGVRISRRFEFQVTYKNLFDAGIYGAEPLPGSIQAALRWYFLN